MFKLNGERASEVTACDVMTMEKPIDTRSLCLVAAHIVGRAYLMFESAEGPTTQGVGALVWSRDDLFVLRWLRSYAVEGSHGGRVEWRDGGWGGYMTRRNIRAREGGGGEKRSSPCGVTKGRGKSN